MNKSELIDAIAADAGITKAAAKLALESFLGNVSGTLKKGGRVKHLIIYTNWQTSLIVLCYNANNNRAQIW